MKAAPLLAAAIALSAATGAAAQLRLPQPLPGALPELSAAPIERLPPPELRSARVPALADLLRRHRDVVEADPAGFAVVRGEVAALDPGETALAAARAAGFVVVRERRLDGLDARLVVLRAPAGVATAAALQRLRALDPDGSYDFNHLYVGSGAPAPLSPPGAVVNGVRVGLIDSGVDARHPALRNATLHRHGCDGLAVPAAHGSAVASLIVAAAPAATLYAADIYCGQPTGGAADALIGALSWLAREGVGVVNVSLVGPPNRLLERALRALVARGHIVVAAVGNDGPAAAPLYPAAYPDVVAVTAVDRRHRVLPEAGRGAHVMFAAAGVHGELRGTSYAAPIVAVLLAAMHARADSAAAAHAIAALAALATDLGAPARDPVYGHGVVGVANGFTRAMEEKVRAARSGQ